MPLIFVNYRTSDEAAAATLVERELSRVFGDDNVFRDNKSIRVGSRYPQELLTAVRRSSVVIVVIGPRWLEATAADGRPALENPEDWTRKEIIEAFETGAFVVPLLVGSAEHPRREDLPAGLEDLADCQHRRLNHRNAEADLCQLAHDLAELSPELEAAMRKYGGGQRPGQDDGTEGDEGSARLRARVIKHRQRGGIGYLNGDLSGTFVSDPQGPVHTGSGNLYHAHEQQVGPRFSGDGMGVSYVADNHGTVTQGPEAEPRPADGNR